jgi:hypothetical protein
LNPLNGTIMMEKSGGKRERERERERERKEESKEERERVKERGRVKTIRVGAPSKYLSWLLYTIIIYPLEHA